MNRHRRIPEKGPSLVAGVATALCLAQGVPVFAAGGSVDLVITAGSRTHSVEMADTIVSARGGKGTITFTQGSGRPFVEGESAPIQYAAFSKHTPSGLDLEADALATFGPDETLQLVFERHSSDPGDASEGALHLVGGSGKFAGISGECRYRMDDLPDRWNVTATCEWLYTFPYR